MSRVRTVRAQAGTGPGRSEGRALWRIRLDVDGTSTGRSADPQRVKALLLELQGRRPAVTLSPAGKRFGVGFVMEGPDLDQSFRAARKVLDEALDAVGLPRWPIVRAAVERERDTGRPAPS